MQSEDGSIIGRCLNGEPETFGILVDKYKSGIYAFVYARIGNFHDAQDITQDVFIEAYKNLSKLRRWENFAFWLYRIASNLCKLWFRDHARHPAHEFIDDQLPETLETTSIDSYRQEQIRRLVTETLESISDTYREVLVMFYFGGMSSREIARALGTSPSAILQRLTRARAKLREDIGDMMEAGFGGRKLGMGFTFRIVETVKRIRPDSISFDRGIPWGISLATGIIIAFFSIGIHINPINNEDHFSVSLAGEAQILDAGEFPVDVMKASDIPVISSQQYIGNGLGSTVPSIQNALFMAQQVEGGTWTKKADMPTARNAVSTSAANGKIYAIGGYNGEDYLSVVEEYDPSLNKWTKKADMSTPRSWLSTNVVNDKIYAMGGQSIDGDNPVFYSILEEYDPKMDTWTKKANMPTGRSWFSTAVVNGKIYAIGGQNFNGPISNVEEYDPTLDKWTRKRNMPSEIVGLSASSVDNMIYVCGGIDRNVIDQVPTTWEYDPSKDKWEKKANMFTKRAGLSVCAVNEKVYAIGGYLGKGDFTFLSAVEEYDPASDSWEKMSDMPTERESFSVSVVNGKIYAIGGNNGNVLSVVEEYIPRASESMDFKGKLPTTWAETKLAQND